MTEPNKSLIRGVARLHDKASRGDSPAREHLRSVSAAASEGELSAIAAMNTLAVVRFAKKHPRAFRKAGTMLTLIEQKDPIALNWALDIQKRAKDGDPRARRILSMLNAHKEKNVASAWATPGSEDGNTRTRNTPMTFGSNRRPAVSGASDTITSAVRGFLRMTPDDEQRLTAMMLRGAASRGVNTTTEAQLAKAVAEAPIQSLGAQIAVFTQAAAPKAATDAALEAYKATLTNNSMRYSAGQMITANNANIKAIHEARTAGSDWDLGFYIGIATSLGNSLEGPGQNAIRDSMFGDIPNEPMRGSLRHKGFAAARAMMYDITLKKTPLILPPTAKSLGRVGPRAAPTYTGLQAICDAAADALARRSPTTPSLVAQCSALRRANIMKGLYVADNLSPNDPTYRVALTDAGNAVIAKNPKMDQFRATLPVSQQRGFTMAMGARAGQLDPKFVAFVTPGLSVDPELLRGFLDGMNM